MANLADIVAFANYAYTRQSTDLPYDIPGGYFDFLHPWPGQTPPPNLIAMGWASEATAGFVGVLRGFLGVDKAA